MQIQGKYGFWLGSDGHACPVSCTCTVIGLLSVGGAHVSDDVDDVDDDNTTPVAVEMAFAEPAEFDAVTATRVVAPILADPSRYD
jgi:hypothetical protein